MAMASRVARLAFVGGPAALYPAAAGSTCARHVCRAPASRRAASGGRAAAGRATSPPPSTSAPLTPTRASLEVETAAAAATYLAEVTETNQSSLYVTALVFFLTAWGGLSFIKGSVKDRLTQASFTLPPATSPDTLARKASAILTGRAYVPKPEADERPGVMTYEGVVKPSTSIATILVSVAVAGLAGVVLMANLVLPPDLASGKWYAVSILGAAVGPWYWAKAERAEQFKCMVQVGEGGAEPLAGVPGVPSTGVTLFVKGHRDEVAVFERELGVMRNSVEK